MSLQGPGLPVGSKNQKQVIVYRCSVHANSIHLTKKWQVPYDLLIILYIYVFIYLALYATYDDSENISLAPDVKERRNAIRK